ncbi:ABC transporter permease [Lentilactobacillus kefiri]|uniref:Uncharacterized protein n=2 Tax=Lentilactobacillus kefiri TaxID=33962 RepID=A0A8E1RKP0_LENKE|nr:ABC transporter permease [Lentilactobacillus kefiri]KRL75284.1 hypothetical protein FD08_GL002189 [Lentilactobacillus parakefiri DSM 10551]KRM53690.1 hypothetical protein FC95_GL000633 [Lentilactobacillus kefiri DSM 20587 = JCM 5818]MCJ2161658.1 ABC transporter permease [Lentilactobacillus kefiri]MCP9369887.1 ABC transporter permease [Lentilactobacillus kefiri]MDH5108406.1 ABC transporter permease [Lentilactobacillus kefiri]
MINQLRADTYRITHSIGFYITLLLVISYSVLITESKSIGGIMVNADQSLLAHLANSNWTILDSIRGLTMSSSALMYVIMSLFVIIIGYEFSQKTYKNTLVSGISRFKFIMAKYVMLLFTIFINIFMYFLTVLATSMILGRKLGASWPHLINISLVTTLAVSFFISIVFSIAILVLMLTNSIVISSVFIVLFPLAVSMLHVFVKWNWLKYIDFFGASNKVAVGTLTASHFGPYILTCGIILVVCIGLSLVTIKEKEL